MDTPAVLDLEAIGSLTRAVWSGTEGLIMDVERENAFRGRTSTEVPEGE